jgi:DnaJ-class molecular chaperone
LNCPKCKGRGVLRYGPKDFCDLCRGRGHLSPLKDPTGYALAKAHIYDRTGEEGPVTHYTEDLIRNAEGSDMERKKKGRLCFE